MLSEVRHHADLPMDGLAARMIRFPDWKPPVTVSSASNPEGVPVIAVPLARQPLELVEFG
jgi:hypothetical protein